MNETRTHVYGIDFSGARNAGRKIWIAHGLIQGRELRIESCCRADGLPDSSQDRDRCLAALHAFILDHPEAVFGLDFPFGLPEPLVRLPDWGSFVLAFPDLFTTADALRAACREADGGKELKRITDRESHAPFSPYNIRLYRQTYYGIRDLLHPLVRDRAVSVLPMQEPQPDRPWLLEICPASTLKKRDLYQSSYKGKGQQKREARVRILEALERREGLVVPQETRAQLIEDDGGDALDSVVAALAVSEALRHPDFPTVEHHSAYAVEGYIYV